MDALTPVILIGLDAAVASLVEDYLASGDMPNLSNLLDRGCYTRARSVFPGVTPINWATVATGAYPGTHGITDFMILDPGDPLDGGTGAFDGRLYRAETLWQAIDRVGIKTATLSFPGAWPPSTKQGYWIGGTGSPATGSPFEIRSSSCFATPGLVSRLRDATPVELQPPTRADALLETTIALCPFKDPDGTGPSFRLVLEREEAGVRLHILSEGGSGQTVAVLHRDCWSDWMTGSFRMNGREKLGTFRFKLTHLSDDSNDFALYCTQVISPQDIVRPAALGEVLVETLGPYIENCGARGYDRKWVDAETFLEEGIYQGLWQARAARYLVEKEECQVVLFKWHFLDHVQHAIWGRFDPISPWFDPATAPYYDDLIRRSYQTADAIVGELLPLLDQGATLVVVSDHGHIPHLKAMSINNLLAAHGLIHWRPGDPKPCVDWKHTVAYAGPCLGHIRVNLKGRDPQGCVEPEDYERVQQQVIDLLLGYRDPQTGRPPVVAALRKQDAVALGHWGERVGDVIYLMREGYTGDINWFPLTEDGAVLVPMQPGRESEADFGQYKLIATKFQSAHGCGFPNARLGRGTEEAILAMAGPHLRNGYTHSHSVVLTDVVPTLVAGTGLPLPVRSEGRIIHEFL